MTLPRLAEFEARRASASLFPGVEDTRWPVRVSTFWTKLSPSPQKPPKIPKSDFFVAESADRPIFLPSIFININSIYLQYNTRKS